jgi:carboxylate-amine ligase
MIRQNKWRAGRYGLDAKIVDPATYIAVPARKVVRTMLARLQDRGDELGCASYLNSIHEMLDQPTGAVRQMRAYDESNDLAEVVRRMLLFSEGSIS